MTAGTRNANFSKHQRAETHLFGFTCYHKNEPGTFINSSPGSFTILFEKLMLLMTEQKRQMAVKPSDRSASGAAPVHKVQSALRIIFALKGTVNAVNGLSGDLYCIDTAVGYW